MSMRRMIYVSHTTSPMSQRDLLDLLHDARGFNAADGITGALMLRGELFVQILEGESEVLDDLWQRLQRDTRHAQARVLYDESVDSRLFGDWSMASAQLDDPALAVLPGVADAHDAEALVASLAQQLPALAECLRELV